MAIEKRYEYTHSIFTDHIESVGAVRRVYFYALYLFGNYDTNTGDRISEVYEWHYYGTTPALRPPPHHTDVPIIQNTYISFPVDFELLGTEANDFYYSMGKIAGIKKEGIT